MAAISLIATEPAEVVVHQSLAADASSLHVRHRIERPIVHYDGCCEVFGFRTAWRDTGCNGFPHIANFVSGQRRP
jgi:hypothetical protein